MSAPVIRARCPQCKTDADLGPEAFTLLFCDDDQTLSAYEFDCTWCGPQLRDAPDYIAKLLMGAGVHTQVWSIDADIAALLDAA